MYVFQDHWLQTPWLQDPWLQGKSDMEDTWALVLILTSSWMSERTRTPDHCPPQKLQTSISPFLSKSPRHSVCYTLSLKLFNTLCPHFLLAHVWFLSSAKPRTYLAGPVRPPLGTQIQPACITISTIIINIYKE